MGDAELLELSQGLGAALKARGLTLALAESCTGGMGAQFVTAVAGSSAWFERGFITYSNAAKIEMLGVLGRTLEQFGAVSEATAGEMALGALRHSHVDVAAGITGIAGPDGGSIDKPVGTVCFGFATRSSLENGQVQTVTMHFAGSRDGIRKQAVEYVLRALTLSLEL